MATDTQTQVIRLEEFEDGQEAECFALLVKKEKGTTKKEEPFVKCYFRDRSVTVEAPLWSDSRFLKVSEQWVEGLAYRLRARGEQHPKFGMQLRLLDIRPAGGPDDEADGYNFHALVERSKFEPGDCLERIRTLIDKYIEDPALRGLVLHILEENAEALEKMPAAQSLHHSMTGGLVEHVWSVTRLCAMLADHYGRYYDDLNPPLNRDVVVAAAVLHDIGKLRELTYHPVEAQYSTTGRLIGHILMGRDLVREAARRLGDISEETLLVLEHAILAHHGKREYGSPQEPATLEAMILHYADELDAKFNAVAKAMRKPGNDPEFTDKIYAVENRRFYRGKPIPPPDETQPPF